MSNENNESNLNNGNNNDFKLYSLAPLYDMPAEELSTYKNYLDNAINEPEYEIKKNISNDNKYIKRKNKNIAVTGNYGAGKSSIIHSFFKDNEIVLYVSLGNYIEQKDSDDYEVTKVEKTKYLNDNKVEFNDSITKKRKNSDDNIEISILQQILYSVRPNEIPYSRFSRIDKFSSKKNEETHVILVSILLTVLLINLFVLAVCKNYYLESAIIYIYLMVSSKLVLFVIIFILLILILRNKLKIKKLSFKDIEVADGNIDESILNKYMDELIHFFLYNNKSIVVFEDIDRLPNCNIILSKLREVNYILNTSIKSKTIQFIYAVGDDVFEGSELRTKFFDILIPIVPVLNVYSAYYFIKYYAEKYGFDKSTLRTISRFFSNQREIFDILNEYEIYSNEYVKKVGEKNFDEEDKKQLLYLVTYKVLYPKKFLSLIKKSEDEKNNSLYEFIDYYFTTDIEKIEKKKIRELIEKINKDIEINDTIIRNMIESLENRISSANEKEYYKYNLYINDKKIDISRLNNITDELVSEILSCFNIYMRNSNNNIDLKDTYITDEVKKAFSLSKDLKIQKNILENKKYRVKMSDIYESYCVDKNIKLNPFEIEMLKQNVIKQNYFMLIGKNECTLSSFRDIKFISNIRGKVYDTFNYHFDKVHEVIEELELSDFLYDNICSFELFDELSKTNDYDTHLESFFSDFSDVKLKFLIEYVVERPYSEMTKNIFKYSKTIWNQISMDFEGDEGDIANIIYLTICHSNPNSLKDCTNFSHYFNDIYESYNILNDNIEKIKDKLCKFDYLEYNDKADFNVKNDKLINYIYDNRLFKYNLKIIEAIFKIKNIEFSCEHAFESIYNASNEVSNIFSKIYDNLDYVINNNVFGYELHDSESIIYKISHSYIINLKTFENLLQIETTKIVDLYKFDDKYLDLLISSDKVYPSWDNINYLIDKKVNNGNNEIVGYLSTIVENNITSLIKDKNNDFEIFSNFVLDNYNYFYIDTLCSLIEKKCICSRQFNTIFKIYSIENLSEKYRFKFIYNCFNLFKDYELFDEADSKKIIKLLRDLISYANTSTKKAAKSIVEYITEYIEMDSKYDEFRVDIHSIIKNRKIDFGKQKNLKYQKLLLDEDLFKK